MRPWGKGVWPWAGPRGRAATASGATRTVSRIRAESRAARRRRLTDSFTPTKRSGERLLTPAGTSFYVRRAGVANRTTGRARGGTPAPTPVNQGAGRRRRRSAARRPRTPGAFYVKQRARRRTTRRWPRPRPSRSRRRTVGDQLRTRRTTGRGGRRPAAGAARAMTARSSRGPPTCVEINQCVGCTRRFISRR